MRNSSNKNNEVSADKMVEIIRGLIKDEINKQNQVVLCQVARVYDNDYCDIYVFPDTKNIIHNIQNETKHELVEGDFVYVFKINNQFSNSFIIHKVSIR